MQILIPFYSLYGHVYELAKGRSFPKADVRSRNAFS